MLKGEKLPYQIIVEWSEGDDAYVARVPAFEGCAAHGDTEADAVREVRVAATAILDVMRKAKRKAPPSDLTTGEYSGQLRLRLPRTLHRRLAQRASLEGASLNQMLVAMVSEQLGRRDR